MTGRLGFMIYFSLSTLACAAPVNSTNIPSSTHLQVPSGPYEPSDPRWATRDRARERDPYADWKTPFDFYGKVVDQYNVPVPDAHVHFSWNDVSLSGSKSAETLTDSRGQFSLKGKKGKGLTVSITHAGYLSAESNPSNQSAFEFANFSDIHYRDPKSPEPTLFRMHKMGHTEPLIYVERTYSASPGTNRVSVILQRGSKADLEFIFASESKAANPNVYWSVSIQGISGTSLVERPNTQDFLAPENGYKDHVDPAINYSDPVPKGQIRGWYYVHLSNGTYARIEAEMTSSGSATPSVTLKILLNPSGSRNLEFDPSKQINK